MDDEKKIVEVTEADVNAANGWLAQNSRLPFKETLSQAFAAHRQNFGELEDAALFARQAFDLEHVAGRDLVLLAACLDYREHLDFPSLFGTVRTCAAGRVPAENEGGTIGMALPLSTAKPDRIRRFAGLRWVGRSANFRRLADRWPSG